MPPRILAMVAASAVVVLSILGCGVETPTYDPAASYSPESLAKEVAFQYRALKSEGAAAEPAGKAAPKEATGIAVKSVKEATKEAQVATLDGIVADVARKAATIRGPSPAEVRGKIADLVEKDPTIAEGDRKAIAAGLRAATP